jgi:two-component system, NarL family, sensor kinase
MSVEIEFTLLTLIAGVALVILSFISGCLLGWWYGFKYNGGKYSAFERISERENGMIRGALNDQEGERRRIAADIHDSLSSILWATKLNIAFVIGKIKSPPNVLRSLLESAKLIDEAMDSSRRIARNLTPEILEILGLTSALEELCSRFSNSEIRIFFKGHGTVSYVSIENQICIYRIVQELINNYIKHSNAKVVSIELYGGQSTVITIIDNGQPFKLGGHQNGLGLLNIRNRIEVLKAKIKSESGPPNKIVIVIPPS